MAVSLRVEIGSYLRKCVSGYDPERGLELVGCQGKTVIQLLEPLGIPREEVAVFTVNPSVTSPDHPLKDGDLVGLFPVALGG